MVVLGIGCLIRAKVFVIGLLKVVVFGQRRLYLGKGKVVVFGQSG